MVSYASLHSSIASAVDEYETYKSQSLRTQFDTLSLGPASPRVPTSGHAKRASLSIPALTRLGSKETVDRPRNARMNSNDRLRSTRNDDDVRPQQPARPRAERMESHDSLRPPSGPFSAFITVARDHENATYAIDLEFLSMVLDFIRSEHPYTSNSLKNSIKQRQVQKKKLWVKYTSQMQGLAKSYASGQTMPTPGPFNGSSSDANIATLKRQCHAVVAKLETPERTCGESLMSALEHFHAQAINDIDARYAMPDPINDKTTPVEKHNERVRVFNQLVKFVGSDLERIERDVRSRQGEVYPSSSKKDKKGSGAVEAVESLCVEDYPPYK